MSGDATTRVIADSGDDIGPGQRLREAREAAHLTAAEVASRMRLEPHIIERLENDEFDRLHGPTFVRGYLSGYARLLNLPERPILEAYERHGFGPPALVSELGAKTEVHVSDFPVRMTTYVIAGLLVVLVVMWWQSRQAPTHPTEVATQDDGTGATRPSADPSTVGTSPAPPAVAPTEGESAVPPAPGSPGGAEVADATPQPPSPAEPVSAATTAPSSVVPSSPPPASVSTPPPPSVVGADLRPAATEGVAPEGAAHVRQETAPDGAESSTEAAGTATRSDGAAEQIAAIIDGAGSAEGAPPEPTQAVPPEAPPARPDPLPGSDVLAIQLKRESWIEVYDRGGGRLYYSLAREGSEIVVTGAGPMRVLLGDVEGAAVAYNGEPFDLSRYAGRSVVRFTVGEGTSATTHPAQPAAPATDAPAPATGDPSEPTARRDGPRPSILADRVARTPPMTGVPARTAVTTWGPPPERPTPPGPHRDS